MIRSPLPDRRRGFTILELLLAASLSSVLLVGAWSMFSMLGKLYDKSQRQAEQSQLVRSLMQQLQNDLDAIVVTQPTKLGSIPDTSIENIQPDHESLAPLETDTFAERPADLPFVGSKYSLAFDFIRCPSANRHSHNDVVSPQFAVPRELARVMYASRPRNAQGITHDSKSGLVRIAHPRGDVRYAALSQTDSLWDLAENANPADSRRQTVESSSQNLSTRDQRPSRLTKETLLAAPRDAKLLGQNDSDLEAVEVDHVPEFEWCEFRYFDGHQWLEQWSGSSDSPLPMAVEMTFDFSGNDSATLASTSASGSTEHRPARFPRKTRPRNSRPVGPISQRNGRTPGVRLVFFLSNGNVTSPFETGATRHEVHRDAAT